MNSKFKIQNSKLFCLLILTVFLSLTGCGSIYIPNLEDSQCTESREAVKKFYSFHFDNGLQFSPDNLKLREKFLTDDFVKSLQNLQTENDIFTSNSDDVPRAFRLGECKVIEPNKTHVEVLLLWRDEKESRQQIINAEAVRQDDKWLINKILR